MGGAFASGDPPWGVYESIGPWGCQRSARFLADRSVDEMRARNRLRFLALLSAALIRATLSHSSAPRERSAPPNECEFAGARPFGRSRIALEVGAARTLASTGDEHPRRAARAHARYRAHRERAARGDRRRRARDLAARRSAR